MKKNNHATAKKVAKNKNKQSAAATKQNKFMLAAGIIASVALLATAAFVVTKVAVAEMQAATIKLDDVKNLPISGTVSPGWYKIVKGSGSLDFNGVVPFNDLGNAAFTVNDTMSSVELGIYNKLPNIRFDSLGSLTYATYMPIGSEKAVTLQIDIDFNVGDSDTSYQGRMVFDPAQNISQAQPSDYARLPLTAEKWQIWETVEVDLLGDIEQGGKWSLTWDGTAAAAAVAANQQVTSNPCLSDTPCSFEKILSLFPNSGLNAGKGNPVTLKAGDGWSDPKGYADALSIAFYHLGDFTEISYNFEPSENSGGGDDPIVNFPLGKEQCWNDRWKEFGDKFKNQGQCISYVVHSNQDL